MLIGHPLKRILNLTEQIDSSFTDMQVTKKEPGIPNQIHLTNPANAPKKGKIC